MVKGEMVTYLMVNDKEPQRNPWLEEILCGFGLFDFRFFKNHMFSYHRIIFFEF